MSGGKRNDRRELKRLRPSHRMAAMLKKSTMTDAAAPSRENPILSKFRAALTEMYGDRLERVVLYGSRARGDAHATSDYDVAVFLKNLTDYWAESNRIALTTSNILSDTGTVIHAMPFPAGSHRERTMLMHEIRREGLDL